MVIAVSWASERLVDWLWMGELGYRSVFWLILDLRLALLAAAFVPLALYFWLNVRAASRLARRARERSGFPGDATLDLLVRFAYGTSFGIADPLLGRDVGFYVFRLPLLEDLGRLAYVITLAVLVAQIALAASLGVFSALDRQARGRRTWP